MFPLGLFALPRVRLSGAPATPSFIDYLSMFMVLDKLMTEAV
jgi:hypothetical protein